MRNICRAFLISLALAAPLFLLGCESDDDAAANNNGQVTVVAPTTAEVLTAQTAVYTINAAGDPNNIGLQFPSSGAYQKTQAGVTEVGTISNLQRTGNTWTATLIPNPGQSNTVPGNLSLTFTSANAGTFQFIPTGGPAQSGSFSVVGLNGGTTGSTAGGTDGATAGSTGSTTDSSSGSTGGNVNDLTGKTLKLTDPLFGATQTFAFSSPSTAVYGGATSATYTYNAATGQFHAALSTGQTYDMVLNFNQGSTSNGTTTVRFTATSGGPPETDQNVSFILQ